MQPCVLATLSRIAPSAATASQHSAHLQQHQSQQRLGQPALIGMTYLPHIVKHGWRAGLQPGCSRTSQHDKIRTIQTCWVSAADTCSIAASCTERILKHHCSWVLLKDELCRLVLNMYTKLTLSTKSQNNEDTWVMQRKWSARSTSWLLINSTKKPSYLTAVVFNTKQEDFAGSFCVGKLERLHSMQGTEGFLF